MTKPVSNSLAFNAAVSRLNFWQAALLDAQKAGEADRVREAPRFVDEYRVFIADMHATKPPEST